MQEMEAQVHCMLKRLRQLQLKPGSCSQSLQRLMENTEAHGGMNI